MTERPASIGDAGVSGYPPEHHVLRDLAIEVQHGRERSRAWLPCPPEVCDEQGRVRIGAVATAVDAVCGGMAAIAAAPGWIATADFTLHVLAPLEASELEARATVRRAGRTTVVMDAEVVATERPTTPLALGSLTFSVLQRRDSNPVLDAPPAEGEAPRRSFLGATNRFTQPVYDACGFVDHGDGAVEVAVHDYIRNSLGGVQGGVLASLVDAATHSALGPGFQTIDFQLTYLALAKEGPLRATARRERVDGDFGAVSVSVHDVGAGRRTTIAQCTGVRW